MRMNRLGWTLAMAWMVPAVAAACDGGASPADPNDDEIGTVVPAGKADDFRSESAQEYFVEGTMTVTLGDEWATATDAEREAEVHRLIPLKQIQMGWFLNQYLVEKEAEGNEKPYGGFKALTKNGSYEDLSVTPTDDPLVWTFAFRQEVGGQMDLIDALGAKSTGPDTWTFDLWVGKVSNEDLAKLDTDREWYRSSPWGDFNPDKVSDDKKELYTLTVRPQPRSDDAWVDYDRLFADGVLTMGIHFGWDYHSNYHLKHSKEVYEWLVARGFESPVASYDDYRHDSGPLVGKTEYDGREIEVQVWLFWGQPGLDTDPDTAAGGRQLEADMLESLRSREITVFNGHSGPFYGFALANWRKTSEGDLDDSELVDVDLNVGNYQMIIAEGCDTYALGEAFYLNPQKPGLVDMDIVTTTSFSNAATPATIYDLFKTVVGINYGKHVVKPETYSEILQDFDTNSYWFSTMYGVHGIDDNPTVHPLADLSLSCTECDRNSDCGDGMRCTKMSDGAKVCTAICTASRDCGEGMACRHTQSSGWLRQRVCVPESLICGQEPTDEPPSLLINELLADPAPGDAGDVNGDGHRDSSQDEFVEILNLGATEADLSGWTLSDGFTVRHVFPTGTVVAPGGALVVFGGGDVKLTAGTTVFQTASTGLLGLNNKGDEIRIADQDGNVLAETRYGAEGGQNMALARTTDGDAQADFAPTAPTPGTKADGSQF